MNELGAAPRWNNPVWSALARALLRLFGWKVEARFPDEPKLVLAAAPQAASASAAATAGRGQVVLLVEDEPPPPEDRDGFLSTQAPAPSRQCADRVRPWLEPTPTTARPEGVASKVSWAGLNAVTSSQRTRVANTTLAMPKTPQTFG